MGGREDTIALSQNTGVLTTSNLTKVVVTKTKPRKQPASLVLRPRPVLLSSVRLCVCFSVCLFLTRKVGRYMTQALGT